LWDLALAALLAAAKAKTNDKIIRFSGIISTMVREHRSEEDAIKAVDLVA
jgi:hypothetical protein